MKTHSINSPAELWDYRHVGDYVQLPDCDVEVSQVTTAAVAIHPDGSQKILQMAATKAISGFEKHQAGFAKMDEIKTDQAKFAMLDLIANYFVDGHYPKEKASYWTYDFRYGPTEFSSTDLRNSHGLFFRHIVYPIKERLRVWRWNRVNKRGAAFERSGKYWFKYDKLMAVSHD